MIRKYLQLTNIIIKIIVIVTTNSHAILFEYRYLALLIPHLLENMCHLVESFLSWLFCMVSVMFAQVRFHKEFMFIICLSQLNHKSSNQYRGLKKLNWARSNFFLQVYSFNNQYIATVNEFIPEESP